VDLPQPAPARPRSNRCTHYEPQGVVLAGRRRQASGGKFRGSLAAQLEVLGKAASAGCQLLDLELQSASKCKPEQLQRLRSKAALIISFHDFRATKNLEKSFHKMAAYPADFYKIVGAATTL